MLAGLSSLGVSRYPGDSGTNAMLQTIAATDRSKIASESNGSEQKHSKWCKQIHIALHRLHSLRCRLRVPRNARICASRVVEYVPQYDEETTPIPYQKPERLVPVQPVANPAPTFFFLHCRTSTRHGRSTTGIC